MTNRSISESSGSAVSSLLPSAMSNTYISQRDFESGPWDERPVECAYGVSHQRSAFESQRKNTDHEASSSTVQALRLETHCVRRNKWARFDNYGTEVCHETQRGKTNVTMEGYIQGIWERSCGMIHKNDTTRPPVRPGRTPSTRCPQGEAVGGSLTGQAHPPQWTYTAHKM